MNEAQADSSTPGAAASIPRPHDRGQGWSWQRWLASVVLVFAAQVALIFALGERHFPPARVVKNVPQFTLVDSSNELVALDDPTLFALPHLNDFAFASRLRLPVANQPSFRWTGPPGKLASPAAENLGAVFKRFMQTNQFAAPMLDFQPEPELSEPMLPLPPVFAESSVLRIEGELAQRQLPNENEIHLPSLPFNDVLAPSKVQALVDAEGNVVSAVLLPSENPIETLGRADKGDTNALRIARSLRFAPAPRVTVGQVIFNWRTVPPSSTNSPAAP